MNPLQDLSAAPYNITPAELATHLANGRHLLRQSGPFALVFRVEPDEGYTLDEFTSEEEEPDLYQLARDGLLSFCGCIAEVHCNGELITWESVWGICFRDDNHHERSTSWVHVWDILTDCTQTALQNVTSELERRAATITQARELITC